MALANFTRRALQQMVNHDAWRAENEWEPIALEIYDEVQAYFHLHNPDQEPHFLMESQPSLGENRWTCGW